MDADDVTQEVMIRIWKNIDKFNIFAAKTWIMKTTNNLCLDYLRKRKIERNRMQNINGEFEETFFTNETKHNPYLAAHENIMASKVKEAIQLLPNNLKSVFVLYEIQGLKYREISKTLNMPVNSVKVYLLRARKKLQEEFKKYDLEEVI